MTFKDEECKGCKGVENFCALPPSGCPCLKCLVISVCDEHCAEYLNYISEESSNIEKLTQVVYMTGSSFWIQRAYLVDVQALQESVPNKNRSKDEDNE